MTVPFISEQIIDGITEALDNEENSYDEAIEALDNEGNSYDKAIGALQAKQPILFSYLLSESFKLLTVEESEYLLYLALVIWKAVDAETKEMPILDSEKIEEAEERNWALFNETTARGFNDKLNVFFDKYPQEDLLAFVEDALVDDEDSFVTKEGKELLFIGLRTTIDALCDI